ncbi:MAG: hypothetical protein ACYDDF_10900 [Thermoplasmatota archaeon]
MRIALLAFAAIVLAGAAFATGLAASGMGGNPAPSKTDYLYLTITQNPNNGIDTYLPANFSVPAGTDVVVTITNYDNGTNPVDPYYSQIRGTVGGTETLYADSPGATVVSGSIDNATVGHTFTISANGVDVNAPIPPATNHPTVVRFTLHFTKAGLYPWNCFAPCDMGAMGKRGYMAGTLTVTA